MISAVLLAFSMAGPSRAPDHPLSYSIDQLGTAEASSQLDFIDRYGCAAVPELVANLRVIRRGHYPPTHQPSQMQRAVYVVVALRYITGENFDGVISRRELKGYNGAGRQFITTGVAPGRAQFFGWWMSRGSFYLAPESTQAQIIAAWKRYARSGACKHSTWPGRRLSDFYLGGIRRR